MNLKIPYQNSRPMTHSIIPMNIIIEQNERASFMAPYLDLYGSSSTKYYQGSTWYILPFDPGFFFIGRWVWL